MLLKTSHIQVHKFVATARGSQIRNIPSHAAVPESLLNIKVLEDTVSARGLKRFFRASAEAARKSQLCAIDKTFL